MIPEALISGMDFVMKHKLTLKEVEVLIPFLEKSYTISELSDILEMHKTTLHAHILKLRLKNLLILKEKDSKGIHFYEFNLEKLGY